tara:strand:+ start:573 stop:725 length:153 start_codon:yes stop_codon:yes gene_type:complete
MINTEDMNLMKKIDFSNLTVGEISKFYKSLDIESSIADQVTQFNLNIKCS